MMEDPPWTSASWIEDAMELCDSRGYEVNQAPSMLVPEI